MARRLMSLKAMFTMIQPKGGRHGVKKSHIGENASLTCQKKYWYSVLVEKNMWSYYHYWQAIHLYTFFIDVGILHTWPREKKTTNTLIFFQGNCWKIPTFFFISWGGICRWNPWNPEMEIERRKVGGWRLVAFFRWLILIMVMFLLDV